MSLQYNFGDSAVGMGGLIAAVSNDDPRLRVGNFVNQRLRQLDTQQSRRSAEGG